MSDADSQRRFITSVKVERSRGPHEYVSVWIRGAKVGTLCVGQGDGEPLRALLEGDRETLNRIAAAADKVLGIDVIARSPELVEKHAAAWANLEEDFAGGVPGFRVEPLTTLVVDTSVSPNWHWHTLNADGSATLTDTGVAATETPPVSVPPPVIAKHHGWRPDHPAYAAAALWPPMSTAELNEGLAKLRQPNGYAALIIDDPMKPDHTPTVFRSCGEDCCFEAPELVPVGGAAMRRGPEREQCVPPFIDPDRGPTEAQLQALKRIDTGLTASLRQDMRRLKRQLETPSNFAEERAKQVLAESLAEAGQDVKP